MDAQNYKKLYPKAFDFCEILKMCEKVFEIQQTFFVIVLYCTVYTQRRCSQIETQLKVEIEDGREAP